MKFRFITLALLIFRLMPASYLCAQEEETPPVENVSGVQPATSLQDNDTPASLTDVSARGRAPEWYAMITNIPGDWAGVGQSAFRSENLPVLGGIAIATGALLLVDHSTYTYTHGFFTRSSDVRFASNQIMRAGDGRTTLGVAAAFALYGFVADDNRALRTASGTVEALLASGIAVQVFKRIAGRESPQVVTRGAGMWRPFPNLAVYNRNQPRYYAFPSGHLTTAMATVTVITENYSEVKWLRPVGYGIVGLTGISLVNKGWHWYSDFPLAIAMGYAFGHLAAHHDEDSGPGAPPGDGSTSFHVAPNVTPQGTGVYLALNF